MTPDDEKALDADAVAEAAVQASLAEDMLALTRVMFGLTVPLAAAPAPPAATGEPMHDPATQGYDDAPASPTSVRPAVAAMQSVPLPDAPAPAPVPDEVSSQEHHAPAVSTPRSLPMPAGISVPSYPAGASTVHEPSSVNSHAGDSAPVPGSTDAPTAIPVPALATEQTENEQSDERARRPQAKRSLDLLQEIAFLDD